MYNQTRLEKANELIKLISSCGKQFFRQKKLLPPYEKISSFIYKKRLYYDDAYSDKLIPCWKDRHSYKYASRSWLRFSEGGTLKNLVKDLATYIFTGEKISNHFGPWPEWYCDGNPWGYPEEDMKKFREFQLKNFD